MSDDIVDRKRAARAAALIVRARCDPAWGALLADHVMAAMRPPTGAVVAGFWPLAGEIDIRSLLERLCGLGHAVVLPATPPRGQPLAFRRWIPGAELTRERFGTYAPQGEAMRPDWLFVPLLAFDRRCRRLGYGGGYYDRTLADLPDPVAIGCGFAAQEMAEIPVGPRDVALAGMATETETFWREGGSVARRSGRWQGLKEI